MVQDDEKMKKWMKAVCCGMAVSMGVTVCGVLQQAVQAHTDKAVVSITRENSAGEPDTKAGSGKKQSAYKRMFMFQKKLYTDTGETSSMLRCGVMDGQITSSVAADKVPHKNGQSNFGKGYGFQYGSRNRMEVCIDGIWHIFAFNENNLEGLSMRVIKNTPAGAVLEIVNTASRQVTYGDDYELEKQDKKTGEWRSVPLKKETAINDIGYETEKDEAVRWKVNWRVTYGKLDAGNYRIVKRFLELKGNGNGYNEYTLSAEFKIRKK